MSRIMGLAAALALFAGASAFAQNSDTSSSSATPPAASSDTSAAPADSDASKSEMKGMHHRHHRHHGEQARNSAASDYDADRLNACHVSANPTPEQEQCLHQAETPS